MRTPFVILQFLIDDWRRWVVVLVLLAIVVSRYWRHRPSTYLTGHDVREGVVFDRYGVRVSAFTVDHGSAKPALGYRIQYRGRVVVLSGDTAYSEHLIDSAKGADLVIHEVAAMPLNDPDTARVLARHTSPEDAAKIFARIRPKMAVYSHILQFGVTDAETIARTRKTYQGRSQWARI
jgi:ribonuclease Z